MEALGIIELNSIAQGVNCADAMLKAADVSIVKSQPICPGKYVVVITGSVSSVRSSVEAGVELGEEHVVDHVIIPRVHQDVLLAMNGCVDLAGVEALGIIETFSVTEAIQAGDQAVKSAEIALMEIRLAAGLGGKAFVLLTGTVSAVRAAVDAAVAMRDEGMIVNTVVIPAPHADLAATLQ